MKKMKLKEKIKKGMNICGTHITLPGICIAEMMTEKEKKWLKEYNKMCYDTMKPLIKDEHVLAWVKKQADKAELL